jgi:hypothetical protein
MPSKTPMAKPAKHVPTHEPAWHRQRPFAFRINNAAMILTGAIRAVRQLADQRSRSLQGEYSTMSMTVGVEVTATSATPPIFYLKHHIGPSHILRQTTSHDPCLLAK